jgi:16S rRNA (guanine1207-N2)-methyltransferase
MEKGNGDSNGTDHYYSENPSVPEELHTAVVDLRGLRLTFIMSSGVFSKTRIDRGTELLIDTLEIADGESALDLGCGYGAIGIAAARLAPGARVTMVDVNRRAVELAQRNAAVNEVDNVEIVHGNGFEAVGGRRFHRIYTNPPYRAGKKLVFTWLEQSCDHLFKGGALYVVGLRKQGILSVKAKLLELYGTVDVLGIRGGYRVLRCRHRG